LPRVDFSQATDGNPGRGKPGLKILKPFGIDKKIRDRIKIAQGPGVTPRTPVSEVNATRRNESRKHGERRTTTGLSKQARDESSQNRLVGLRFIRGLSLSLQLFPHQDEIETGKTISRS
jgi:hypothetical protein